MALISKTYTFSTGAVIVAAEHNTNNDTIYNDYNGNITNANLASGAAIADTKLAQLTTAGKVIGAALTGLASIPAAAGVIPIANLTAIYPVGSIYIETTGVNPGTTFGFGTWGAFGAGRVIIGTGGGYSAGTTGGEATHTLTTGEIPAHTHTTAFSDGVSGALTRAQLVASQAEGTAQTSSSTGTGGAHNTLPPYIVTYMWQRTA